MGDLLPDENAIRPEDRVFQSTLEEEALHVLEEVLTERERLVLHLHFGLGGGQPFPLAEIGQQLDLTRERVRQIESEALRKLRPSGAVERLDELRPN